MIISYICGGLGNQMFQYAAARRLAVHLGTDLKLDLNEYKTGNDQRPAGLGDFARTIKLYELNISTPAATDSEIASIRDSYVGSDFKARLVRRVRKYVNKDWLWPASHLREKGFGFDVSVLDRQEPTYLQGYWQSQKYFADIADVLRTEFQPKDHAVRLYARQYLDRLRSLGGPVVALHVRRGDLAFATERLKSFAGVYSAPLGLEYIRTAMAQFDQSVRYLVFSDTARDIDWCRQNIPAVWPKADRLHFSEGHSDIQDMALMSSCDHNIIANSTFSWWSAWLNRTAGRRVIAPARWCTPGSPAEIPTKDLLPPEWETI